MCDLESVRKYALKKIELNLILIWVENILEFDDKHMLSSRGIVSK